MGHHFESELAKAHPELDLSDMYAFQSDRAGFTAFVMCQNPQSAAGKIGLTSTGLYNLHIAFDRESSKGLTVTFQPSSDDVRIGLVKNPSPPLGEVGGEIGRLKANQTVDLDDGIKIWIGVAKDPFVGNATGLKAFEIAAREGVYKPTAFDNKENSFINMLTTAIVIELPNSMMAGKIYYSGTSAWFDHGHWHQVNRIGHVLLPHLYLENAPQVEAQMTSAVSSDSTRRSEVATLISRYASLAGVQKDPSAYGQKMAEFLLPDVVPYEIGTPAAYGVEHVNGRHIDDPSMDVALHWLVGTPTSAQSTREKRSSPEFPYLIKAN